MREIKFRAWDPLVKEMFYFKLNDIYGGCYDNGGLIPVEIMQFTGLQDKNGVDIYECDIVDGVLYKDYTTHMGKINYDFNGYRIVTSEKSMPLDLTEKLMVIGNIHENKELLK